MGIQSKQHQDVNYLVVGLGVTGFSVANYLLAHGSRCRVQDTRDIPRYLKQLKHLHPRVEVVKSTLDDELVQQELALQQAEGESLHARHRIP